jgi:hypothetical protein
MSVKLYSRELCSTIDAYKNGKNAYIYSKQNQQQNEILHYLTLAACLHSQTCRLISFARRHLNCAWLQQGE